MIEAARSRPQKAMRFDARTNDDPATRKAFVDWLVSETVSSLQRAEDVRAAVFLYLNRAYEAHLASDYILDLFGVGPGSILSQAKLSPEKEAEATQAFEALDPVAEGTWSQP